MQIGVVVVTHGQLATELVNSAEMIVGDLPQFAAVSIGWHDDVDQARQEIGRAIERVATTAGTDGQRAPVLVLSDMFGGTPANLGVTFVSPDVEVITGVNLPMLIKLARPQKTNDLLTIAREMREVGRNAIWVASDLLRGEKSSPADKAADASAKSTADSASAKAQVDSTPAKAPVDSTHAKAAVDSTPAKAAVDKKDER